MDTKALEERLEQRLNDKQAVYAVVALMGSTEQGAIDPLSEVLEIRKKFEARGLSFVVHADAAWGGYFASMLRERRRLRAPRDGRGFVPQLPLPRYTEKELLSLKDADSVTIDPHKSGYIPYPAGGLCYKDERMKYPVTWKSPIVYRDDQPFSMGVYGIEGSKPGAAPVAAYLSHEVLGLHREGYGALLGEAIFSCTKMYCHWATMSTCDIIVTPFNLLPAEKEGCPDPKKIEKQKQFIRERILNRPNIELVGDEETWKLVKELGSDLCINAFACNFRIKDKVNEDIVEANYFNTRLFERLSITQIKDDMQSRPLILTSSVFTQDDYQGCLTHFKNRLGLVGQQDLYALVNVIMSPFPTEGNFSGQLAEESKNRRGGSQGLLQAQ
ncbi:hypothetical protein FRC03_000356 [Tulasnella sp. 419]|nr:hypothetical protein FRC03_000356 [Tulasnella sp. 419]